MERSLVVGSAEAVGRRAVPTDGKDVLACSIAPASQDASTLACSVTLSSTCSGGQRADRISALTPPRSRLTPGWQQARASLTPPPSARAGEGSISAVAGFVRRELERLEVRLTALLGRGEEAAASALERSERLQHAALQRLDHRFNAQEGLVSKLDRKVSELVGAVRGLSDETQVLLRRIDAADARSWTFRRELEEEFRQRCQDIATSQQETVSKCRVLTTVGEEAHKRQSQSIRRIETALQEHTLSGDQLGQAVAELRERLEIMDAHRSEIEVLGSCPTAAYSEQVAEANDEWVARVEARVSDVAQKVERLNYEAYGDNGWSARLEEHEVRIAGTRSKLDSQNEQRTALDVFVREDLEGKLEQIRRMVQDSGASVLQQSEQLEALSCRIRSTDQATEDLRRDFEQAVRSWMVPATGAPGGQESLPSAGSERGDFHGPVTEHIKTLVLQLKAVVPRVVEHDRALRDFRRVLLRQGTPPEDIPMEPTGRQLIASVADGDRLLAGRAPFNVEGNHMNFLPRVDERMNECTDA